jgi:hypothetical protein
MRIFGRRSELPHNLGEILSFAVLGFGSRGFLLCSFPKELGQGEVSGWNSMLLQLEKRVNEVTRFFDGKKHGSGGRKAGGSSRYATNGARDCKGTPDLTRQLGGIIRQVIIHS